MTTMINKHGLPLLKASQPKRCKAMPFNFDNNTTYFIYAKQEYKRFIERYNHDREIRRCEREAAQQRQADERRTITSELF